MKTIILLSRCEGFIQILLMRYFITLAYDGTDFHGWQIQPNGNSVQEELQKALSTLMRQPMEVVGAGRTDAGVHARKMVAHFDSDSDVDCQQLAYRLNRMVPRSIAIYKIENVADDMHARFSAKRRTYRYFVHTHKNPFLRHYSYQLPYSLDFNKMNKAACILKEYSDFGAFCKSHSDVKTTICKVTEAEWHQTSPCEWYFEISADRFLRNMVRAVVGTLIDVGRSRLSIEDFRGVIEGRKRTAAGESMPGNALFLENVEY